jgi:hypothetical protein
MYMTAKFTFDEKTTRLGRILVRVCVVFVMLWCARRARHRIVLLGALGELGIALC